MSAASDMPANERPECRLYLITPERVEDIAAFAKMLEEAIAGGDVACLQLRLKGCDDAHIVRVAEALMPLCHAHDIAFLINDRADLALQCGADGVHLGQGDGDIAEARRLLGQTASIGATCHDSMHLAFEAGEAGADYVAFGSFFPSKTKASDHRPEPEILAQWTDIAELPCVAIGGIGIAEAALLAASGADFIAVSSGVWQHAEGPKAAVTAYNQAIARPKI